MAKLATPEVDHTAYILGKDPETGVDVSVADLDEKQAKNHLCYSIAMLRKIQEGLNDNWTLIRNSCYRGGRMIGDEQ